MNKLKLMTVIGTRPEIIRLSEVIKACDIYFEHILVHTGQNWDYTLNELFFEDLNIREPDYCLECVGDDVGQTIGNIIDKSYKIIKEIRPDALLILGDTNSALSAISAKRLKVPIFHMEAGNRCFDPNVPEEINRKIVDHIADINLAYTEHSRRYLLSEGIEGRYVFVTGSPMTEVLHNNMNKIQNSKVLDRLSLSPGKYLLVSAHREENIDHEKHFISLMNSLNLIAETYEIPVIYSTHPRSMKFIEQRQFKFNPLVKSMKPFCFSDYNCLQKNAFCVLSDSGTLSEESSILGFPAVLIRTSTERPEVLDKGSIVIGGIDFKNITQAIEIATASYENEDNLPKVSDYTDINISLKVVKIIQSYTKITDEFIWRKMI